LAKKKDIHYYKCNTVGCCNNKNASKLNETFYNILNHFSLQEDAPAEVRDLIKVQMTTTFNEMTDGQQDDLGLLESQLFDLNKKIERLEERYIEEEISTDLYNKYGTKYLEEKKGIEEVLWKSSRGVSNLTQSINLALSFVSKMAFK
jgi:site-specific DNA recombinase